ncbi:MAG TPA: hypothetical protein VGQ83_04450 [Polyangia bacterium]
MLAVLALTAGGCATGSATNQLDAAPLQQDDAAPVQDDAAPDAPADVAAAEDAALDAAPQDAQRDTAPQDAQHDTAPAGCTDDSQCNVAGGEYCFVAKGKCFVPGTCYSNDECLSGACSIIVIPPGTCTCTPFPFFGCRPHESCIPGFNFCQ